SADIVAEQEKVMWCDLMIFQFPIWWFSMPAILKAWVERVMARGFAYGGGRKHAKGVFLGRKAMVSCTMGTAASTYAEDGIEGHIQNLLGPVTNGVFHYMGFEPLPSFVACAPRNLSTSNAKKFWRRMPSGCRLLIRPSHYLCIRGKIMAPINGCFLTSSRKVVFNGMTLKIQKFRQFQMSRRI